MSTSMKYRVQGILKLSNKSDSFKIICIDRFDYYIKKTAFSYDQYKFLLKNENNLIEIGFQSNRDIPHVLRQIITSKRYNFTLDYVRIV